MTSFNHTAPAAAVAQVKRTVNVTDTTINKVVRNTLRLSVKAAKSEAYVALRETEAAIRDKYRTSAREARLAALTEVSADNLLAAIAPKSPVKKTSKTSEAEKAEIAAAYHQNRADLAAEIDNCMAAAALLHNQLMTDYANGLFDEPNVKPVKQYVGTRILSEEELSAVEIA